MKLQEELKQTLISKINKSEWWHVRTRDPHSFEKRGQFLCSTFRDAEFYGRPIDMSIRVCISNPVFGFSEQEIWEQLFPEGYQQLKDLQLHDTEQSTVVHRFYADAIMAFTAQASGYDSIVLICPSGKKSLENNRKPRAIELNILYPFKIREPRFEKLKKAC